MRGTEAGRNSSCTNTWTSLDYINSVFIFRHVSLYLTFSTAVYIWKGTFFSQMLVNASEHVCQGFVVEDTVADILRQQQWRYRCKSFTQNAYQRIHRRKMTCFQLLLTALLSQYEMTALVSEALLAF
jgi:hypothetical protein